jgi:hypothetical protein
MSTGVCEACRHQIDEAAKVCPYCGADPRTGQKLVDTEAILREVFQPKQLTTSETVLEYARQRQGVVVAVSAIVIFIILAALHQFITSRNESAVSASPAVPLTEVADLSNERQESRDMPMPDLDFQYSGSPGSMRTFIIEAGAVTPPEIAAAQQAQNVPPGAAAQPRPAQTPPQGPIAAPRQPQTGPRPPAR